MSPERYPFDFTDAEWMILEPLVPVPLPGGRPPRNARREIVNAILSVRRAFAKSTKAKPKWPSEPPRARTRGIGSR